MNLISGEPRTPKGTGGPRLPIFYSSSTPFLFSKGLPLPALPQIKGPHAASYGSVTSIGHLPVAALPADDVLGAASSCQHSPGGRKFCQNQICFRAPLSIIT